MTLRLTTGAGVTHDIRDGHLVSPGRGSAFSVHVDHGEVLPGLINAHDHLHRNHYPRLGAPPYPDAYVWGTDLHTRHAAGLARARRLARSDALLFGALKNLLGGVTTVVHHDAWESDFTHTFPVRVARVRTAHSLRFEPDLAAVVAGTLETAQAPLCLHVAEGTTRAMADEVRTLDAMHLLDARLIAVHAVGVDEDGATRLARAGAACVWCPSSNRFLFGHTIPPGLARAKLDILLGTDSLLTGDGTLLDELRLARRLGILDDGRLRDAVGATAARRLSLPAPSLAPGAPADLVVLQRPLFEARPADVALVLVHGQVQLADEAFADLFARQGRAAERLEVGGVMKVVARPLGTVARRVADLTPECARVFS